MDTISVDREGQAALPVRDMRGKDPRGRRPGDSRARLFWLLRAAGWAVLLTLGIILLLYQILDVSHQAKDFCQDYAEQ